MKKLIMVAVLAAAGLVFAANYEADTLNSTDKSYGGDVVAQYFSYAIGTTEITNSTIYLTRIPPNAMIIDGIVKVTAMGGGQKFAVGLVGADGSGYYTGTTANDVDLILNDISCSNDVYQAFCDLSSATAGAPVELGNRPVYLTISNEGGNPAWSTNNETITGWVKFIEP